MMDVIYAPGGAVKDFRKYGPLAICTLMGIWTAYEIYRGNFDFGKEIGKAVTSILCVGAGGTASIVDYYEIRDW